MNPNLLTWPRGGVLSRLTSAATLLLLALLPTRAAEAPVALTEDASGFTLDNGIVSVRASKNSGDLMSLKYRGLEMLSAGTSRQAGYWSHNTQRGQHLTAITIDPKSNGGERAEVSIKGLYDGTPLGSGPGGSVIADIEIRYCLGRGDSGVYTYSIFEHKTNYPATSLGEARFCVKLNDELFDWMTVDANRNMKLITAYDWNHGTVMNFKEARRMNSGIYKGQVEHKYDYSANQFDVRAWGWSSTAQQVGFWFVNPSVEYLSCGPTKAELSAHRDATFGNDPNAPAPPTLLNYWRSSHYGSSVCSIARDEAWVRVVGPFLIYCNGGKQSGLRDTGPQGLWQDALARASKEAAAWPFGWVEGVDYPHRSERGTLRGQLVLCDTQVPNARMTRLLVGLTAPESVLASTNRPGGESAFGQYRQRGGEGVGTNTPPERSTNSNESSSSRLGSPGGFGRFFGPRTVTWQNDAKHYQFWVLGETNGTFTIPNVRPGSYTLHAIADGVLGEFTLTNVTLAAGQTFDLGKLNWTPVRYGRQLWEVGIPNRSAAEFFKGDDYFHWGWYLEYPKLFPKDVNYIVGKSDFHKDWFFEQVPHNENPTNTTGTGNGRSTSWSITFNLPEAPHGKATLRLGLCSVESRSLTVSVNDQEAGNVTGAPFGTSIQRDAISGYWAERNVVFDAALMKAGDNVLKLTIPAGRLTSGVMYDYLRLELDEAAPAR